jgi:hypothetical protein
LISTCIVFSSFVDNSIPRFENQIHRFSISGRFLKISGYYSKKQSRQAGIIPLGSVGYNSILEIYSHSIAPKQFRVGIIICTICGSFDYLIYPYSPAYIPSCYHFVISVDNSKGI